MANPWFRMYAEFANDPKVQMLSETDQRRLTMIFCLRCNGLVTLQDSEVTFLLRISNDEWVSTKAQFVEKGFINKSNEVLNWDKRQFSSDTSKNRVAAYRERKKNESNDAVTLPKQKSNAVEQIQNRTEQSNAPRALLEVEGVPKNLINDWLKVRKEKKQPLTQSALDATKRESAKAGLTLTEAITVCCENSWAGFKASYMKNIESVTDLPDWKKGLL